MDQFAKMKQTYEKDNPDFTLQVLSKGDRDGMREARKFDVHRSE